MTDSANLDLVRSIYAEWERGDFTSAEWAHPEIEYVWAEGPSPGRWKGVAAAGEGFRGWTSAWEARDAAAKAEADKASPAGKSPTPDQSQ